MAFERQDVGQKPDLEELKKQLTNLVGKELAKEKTDPHLIYSLVKDRVGIENIDDNMLNFAINSAFDQINKAKLAEKPLSGVDFDRQVDLVVNWALIKIKRGSDSEIGQIDSGKIKDIDYGTGGDNIILKDFKIR